jgi:ABC-type polysaccharide/polyol phosphate export permease
LAAYLPFTFFQLCLLDSAQSILGAMPLIKKIYFPREILPLASVISNFIHLVLAMGMFFLFLLGVYIIHPGAWPIQVGSVFLPVLLLISFCLSLGCSFYISALNTFYEDVKYVVSIVLWLMFFMTPVMYFSEKVANSPLNQKLHGWLFVAYNLNPVAALASAYRKTLLAPPHVTINGVIAPFSPMNWNYLYLAAATSLFILVTGYATFNRLKWRFVERP